MSNLDNSRTKNVVSNLVSQARESDQDDEDRRLVSCDLCFQPLRRCVGVSCCPAPANLGTVWVQHSRPLLSALNSLHGTKL